MSQSLLASAPTMEAIRESIAKFYGGTSCYLLSTDVENVWTVHRYGDNKQQPEVRVIKIRNRFRFEMV